MIRPNVATGFDPVTGHSLITSQHAQSSAHEHDLTDRILSGTIPLNRLPKRYKTTHESMIYSNNPRPESIKSLSDAIHVPFWLDDPAKPTPEPPLTQNISTDLLVIGAGFAGLWTACRQTGTTQVVLLGRADPPAAPVDVTAAL
jgi:hypothetical protein